MERVYLFDNETGEVYRGLITGTDKNGELKWFNITPGQLLGPVKQFSRRDPSKIYDLLSMCDEPVLPVMMAKVLALSMRFPYDKIDKVFENKLMELESMGAVWNYTLPEIHISVTRDYNNEKNGSEKYLFTVTESEDAEIMSVDIDCFDNMKELFSWVNTYLRFLERKASIRIEKKYLHISNELIKDVSRDDLYMFNHVDNEE